MEESEGKNGVQCHCRSCGKFLPIKDMELCDSCYGEFDEWSSKRFLRLSKIEENPIQVWLRERKQKK